jgi:hypothetical protein
MYVKKNSFQTSLHDLTKHFLNSLCGYFKLNVHGGGTVTRRMEFL